jgi:hypothetical protein
MSGRKVWAADEVLTAVDLQDYIQDQVVFVYANASARSAGILAPTEGMVSYLQDTNALEVFNGSAWVDISPNVGTAGTYTKVTTDAKGRVSSGTTLSASDIPDLDAAKIQSGFFSDARIPALSTDKITSGVFNTARIPNLDGSKITTGNIAGIFSVDTSASGFVDTGLVRLKNGVGGYGITLTGSNGNAAFGGAVTVSGALNVSNGFGLTGNLFAPTTYNQTNTGRAMFVAADGLYGIGASSIRFKENVVDADINTEAVLDIQVRKFNYKKSFDKHETKDVGVIAEELEALGLTDFIYYDADGIPDGVAYEKLALLLIPVLKLQSEKLDALEARLDRLEK